VYYNNSVRKNKGENKMDWENLKTQLYRMVDDFIDLSKSTVEDFNLEVKDCFPYEGTKWYEGNEIPSSIIRLQINLEEKEG
jgi:hypothetical protein